MTGSILNWIEHFLSGRRQQVVINGEASPWLEVLSCVPQGSVLGIILFICFVNDLPEVVHCGIQMFADDTKVVSKISSREDQATSILQKCKAMHLGINNPCYGYEMEQSG